MWLLRHKWVETAGFLGNNILAGDAVNRVVLVKQ